MAQAQGTWPHDQAPPLELRLRNLILDGAQATRRVIAPRPLGPEARQDVTRIAAHHADLFVHPPRIGPTDRPADFAVFYTPGNGDLIARLTALSDKHDLSIALHPSPAAAPLAHILGLDLWPSYVFPALMLRGDVPVPLLLRYVRQ